MSTAAAEAIPLRLVEWNVNMSLQTKTELLAELCPGVAVLPESAHPDKTGEALRSIGATSWEWIGASPNKGLLAVAFGEWTVRVDADYDPGYQWVLPLHLSGPATVRMLAVWDMNHRGSGHSTARKLGSCRASIDHYARFLAGDSDLTVVTGDFNNSVYWDKPNGAVKFGDFMDQLQARGLVSAYHLHQGCARGAEPQPTLWWMKSVEKPYHVDYTFVSPAGAVEAVALGSVADWLRHSDHSPMTVDLRVPVRQPLHAPEKEIPMFGSHSERFDVAPGALDDMVCGENGRNLIQSFRPTYVTAKWSDGTLVEVRIWGPQILKDGSLGARPLDHYWHSSRAAGGVRYEDLPTYVADRLRGYRARSGRVASLR